MLYKVRKKYSEVDAIKKYAYLHSYLHFQTKVLLTYIFNFIYKSTILAGNFVFCIFFQLVSILENFACLCRNKM